MPKINRNGLTKQELRLARIRWQHADWNRRFDHAMLEWHLARARALGASCYCVWHACDARKCPDDGVHTED